MEKQDVSVSSKDSVVNALRRALSKKDEIIFAYLHGSYLEGVLFNDIDVAIYLDGYKTATGKHTGYCDQLNGELSELIGVVVDVRTINHAPAGFQHSVYKHGRLLFSRDEELRTDLIEENSMDIMVFHELSMQSIRDMVYNG